MLQQIIHTTSSITSHTGWRDCWMGGWGEWSVYSPATHIQPWLWVTSSHYPSAACTSSRSFPFQISIIYSGLALCPSLPSSASAAFQPPLLWLVHFVTPAAAFPLYLQQQTTAPLRGSRVFYRLLSHCSRHSPLSPQLCQMSTGRFSKLCSGKTNNLVYLHSKYRCDIDWWAFSKREQLEKKWNYVELFSLRI